jgi:hypothetical protein
MIKMIKKILTIIINCIITFRTFINNYSIFLLSYMKKIIREIRLEIFLLVVNCLINGLFSNQCISKQKRRRIFNLKEIILFNLP